MASTGGRAGRALVSAGCALIGLLMCAGGVVAQAVRTAATGLVECGGAVATGQLTGAADRITTAAHVLFDEAGRSRASLGPCVFRLVVDGSAHEFAIRPGATTGSRSPYAHAGGSHDWAVARLATSVRGVTPYRLGRTARIGERVTLAAARRRSDAPLVVTGQSCRVIAVGRANRGGEIRTDCDGRTGDSGAAYLSADGRLVGVHVGMRLPSGLGLADGHAFGVAAEGAFRSAAMR